MCVVFCWGVSRLGRFESKVTEHTAVKLLVKTRRLVDALSAVSVFIQRAAHPAAAKNSPDPSSRARPQSWPEYILLSLNLTTLHDDDDGSRARKLTGTMRQIIQQQQKKPK